MTRAETTTVDPSSPARASGALRFAVVAMLFLSYMLFAVAWNWGDLYVRSLGFSATRTALMTNAITIAQVVGSLVAANILLRLGPRNAFTLASALIVAGGLVSLTEAFPLIFFIRFVLGLGGAVMVVLLSGIVARLLDGTALQIANGVNSVAFNTGLAVALTFGIQMAGDPAFAVVLAAALSLSILVLWLLVSRAGLRGIAKPQAVDRSYTMRDGFREWFNWVFALAYTGLLSYYIVAFTFMDAATVRWVVYAGVIGALSGTVVSARVPDTVKPVIVVASGALQIVAAALVLAMADHRLAVVVGVILGLVIFFPMPFFVQLAFIRPGVTPRQVAVTFSIFWAVSYAGSVVIIQVFAWIADLTGGLGPGSVPVSTAPMIFIVIVESTFLVGAVLLWRWFRASQRRAAALG